MKTFRVEDSTDKTVISKTFKADIPIVGRQVEIPEISPIELVVIAHENEILKLQNPHTTYICEEIS